MDELQGAVPSVSYGSKQIDAALARELAYKASKKQVGGNHYKKFVIQPAEFCYKNRIPYLEATAIKYLCRWKDKGGIQDLNKAIHFIELLKEFHNAEVEVYKNKGSSTEPPF